MSVSSPSDAMVAGIGASTSMRVAADLRRRILNGELLPGSRLTIDDVAETCHVSHMPVRDALHELEREGVLDVSPRRGAMIRTVDAHFVRNTYDLRAAIEGLLTERCAAAIDAAGIEELHALAAAFDASTQRPAVLEVVQANRRLHDMINRHADNDEAIRVLGRGRLLVEALRLRFGFGPRRMASIVAEHRQLLAAIAARQVERAGRLAREHCERARDDLLARL
jgi:DNA-binding GntR family transcriptional regulator